VRLNELDSLVERMTKISPDQRQSMAEVNSELSHWLQPPLSVDVPDVDVLTKRITAYTARATRGKESRATAQRAANTAMETLRNLDVGVVHNRLLGRIAGSNGPYGPGIRGCITPNGGLVAPDASYRVGWQSEGITDGEPVVAMYASGAASLVPGDRITVSASLIVMLRALGSRPDPRVHLRRDATAPVGSSQLRGEVEKLSRELVEHAPQGLEAVVRWLVES
jgi:hypothetical protein